MPAIAIDTQGRVQIEGGRVRLGNAGDPCCCNGQAARRWVGLFACCRPADQIPEYVVDGDATTANGQPLADAPGFGRTILGPDGQCYLFSNLGSTRPDGVPQWNPGAVTIFNSCNAPQCPPCPDNADCCACCNHIVPPDRACSAGWTSSGTCRYAHPCTLTYRMVDEFTNRTWHEFVFEPEPYRLLVDETKTKTTIEGTITINCLPRPDGTREWIISGSITQTVESTGLPTTSEPVSILPGGCPRFFTPPMCLPVQFQFDQDGDGNIDLDVSCFGDRVCSRHQGAQIVQNRESPGQPRIIVDWGDFIVREDGEWAKTCAGGTLDWEYFWQGPVFDRNSVYVVQDGHGFMVDSRRKVTEEWSYACSGSCIPGSTCPPLEPPPDGGGAIADPLAGTGGIL